MKSYDDILKLSRPISKKYPKMSRENRAAQFAPFAALTGHDAAIAETGRYTEEKVHISENVIEHIDYMLQEIQNRIEESPKVLITYFKKDEKKSGGHYLTVEGFVKKIDAFKREIVLQDGIAVFIDAILQIELVD